jgi:hypothetical protein
MPRWGNLLRGYSVLLEGLRVSWAVRLGEVNGEGMCSIPLNRKVRRAILCGPPQSAEGMVAFLALGFLTHSVLWEPVRTGRTRRTGRPAHVYAIELTCNIPLDM